MDYKGQHLYIKKASGTYTHHGLGVGDGYVIHYSGLADDLTLVGEVEEVTLEEFSQGKEIHVKQHHTRKYDVEESILRASLRMGEEQYHILYNNCEHFVQWCISGRHKSDQSTRGKILYSAGMGARALWGAKNPVGFVAGAAAGYAYIHYQGRTKLEEEFERVMNTKERIVKP